MLPDKISKFKSRIIHYYDYSGQQYLHSRRRYLINSIPLLSIVALLVGISSVLLNMIINNGTCYATEATTSLKITTPELSDTIMPNTTSYLSSEVIYSAENIESYALKVSYAEGSNSLKLENGATTIADTTSAQGTLTKNTWGYAWGDTNVDNSTLTYQAMPSYNNATTIEQGTEDVGSTTKKIVFAANIGDDMPAGHYKTNVLLSLVATPKVIALGVWSNGTNSGITTMQEMTPEICNQVDTPTSTADVASIPTMSLKDARDDNVYVIAKYPDGRCWMVENLNLRLSTTKALTSADSNVSSWTPTQNTIVGKDNLTSTDFSTSDYYKAQSYADSTSATTTYYSWMAATAGAGTSSVTTAGTNVSSSICPKGWTLPTGQVTGKNTSNDFYNLFSKMNLGVTVGASGSTSWGSSQGLAISQASPYNFAYTGRVVNGAMGNTTGGDWWSRTTNGSTSAYYLGIYSSFVSPGTDSNSRFLGFAVRCIAKPVQYQITYSRGTSAGTQPDSFITNFASAYPTQVSPDEYSGSSYSFKTHASAIKYEFSAGMRTCTREVDGWSLTDGGDIKYSLGSSVTLPESDPSLTLYAHYKLGGDPGCFPA